MVGEDKVYPVQERTNLNDGVIDILNSFNQLKNNRRWMGKYIHFAFNPSFVGK